MNKVPYSTYVLNRQGNSSVNNGLMHMPILWVHVHLLGAEGLLKDANKSAKDYFFHLESSEKLIVCYFSKGSYLS